MKATKTALAAPRWPHLLPALLLSTLLLPWTQPACKESRAAQTEATAARTAEAAKAEAAPKGSSAPPPVAAPSQAQAQASGSAGKAEAPVRVKLSPAARAALTLGELVVRARPLALQVSTFVAETRLQDDAAVDVVAPARRVLQRLGAQTGDAVAKGALLAVLRSPEVGRARAAVRVAEAKLAAAEQQAGQARKLVAAGVGTAQQQREAEAGVVVSRAQRDEARGQLAALGVGLKVPTALEALPVVEVRAPAAGTVLERPLRRGGAVEAGGLLFRLADLDKVWLAARLGEREAAGLREGARAEVRLAARPGQPLRGEVVRALGLVEVRSRTTELRVRVDDPERTLRPGMAASVTFTAAPGATQALLVPQGALQRIDGQDAVFVVVGQGEFEKREVERGRTVGAEVEVRGGLRAGERIVGEGAFWLRAELARSQAPEEQ